MQNHLNDSDAALVMQFLQNPEGQALRRLLLQTGSASQPSSPAPTHTVPSSEPQSDSSVPPCLNPIASHYQSARAQFASMLHMAVSHFNATATLADLTSPASRFLYVGALDRNITMDNYLDVHLCAFSSISSAMSYSF